MKLAPSVKFREEKFGGVLFETLGEKVYCLNRSAAAVVRALAEGGGEPEIVARLQARFRDGSGVLESDARGFLDGLKERGLLTD